MILDQLLLLSDAQAFTATGLSTNTIDLGNPTTLRQVGDGEPLAVTVQIDVAADFTTGDETYAFEVIQSAAAALTTTTVLTRQAYIASGVMISTLLIAGFILVMPLPAGYPLQRYLGLNFIGGGTTPTITFTAWLGPWKFTAAKPQTYAKAYTITG